MWVLGKSGSASQAASVAERAMTDGDADLRIVGLRLARQIEYDIVAAVSKLVDDPSSRVRRECLVALKTTKSQDVPGLWARLASGYDGLDRWYLEALGIAADGRWDACLAARARLKPGAADSLAGRRLTWRSRGTGTAARLAEIISDTKTPLADLPGYLRALDYQSTRSRHQAALALVTGEYGEDTERSGLVIREALEWSSE